MRLKMRVGTILTVAIASGAFSVSDGLALPVSTNLKVTLDGATVARCGIRRLGSQPIVALKHLAIADGWRIVRLRRGVRLQGHDRTVEIAIGSREILEDSSNNHALTEALGEREGELYIPAGDAARLFGLTLASSNRLLAFRHPEEIEEHTTISESPAAPKSTPRARVTSRRVTTGPTDASRAGRVLLSMDRSGAFTTFSLAAETHGPLLQSSVYSTAINGIGPPTGRVTIGTKDKNVNLGATVDPLSGLILRGGGANGISFNRANVGREIVAAKRLLDDRSIVGLVSSARENSGSDVAAIVFHDGRYEQTILRRLRIVREPWGEVTRELLVGDRGMAGAIKARTRGRTFVESTAAFATRGLPLGPNDAPISIDVGRDLSPQTTAAAGFATGPQQSLGPFVGISTRSRVALAALSASARTVTGSVSYQVSDVSLQAYAIPGPQHQSGAQARFVLPGSIIDAVMTNSVGAHEAAIEFQTVRRGVNVIAGAAVPSGGHAGPIVGVSIPFGRALAIEARDRPAASGKSAVKISIAIGIAARHAHGPTLPVLVRVSADGPVPQLQLFVDGSPVARMNGPTATVNVTPGDHAFSVESLDRSSGSRESWINVVSANDSVNLLLGVERAIHGRIELDPTAAVPPNFSLGGLVVVVQPENVMTETAADGSFSFEEQPFGTKSSIGLDAAGLPRTLRVPDVVPPQIGDTVLVLRTGLPVERVVFP